MASLDLNKAMEEIAAQNQGMSMPFSAASMQIAKTGATEADNAHLLSVFRQAFPDMDFEVSNVEGSPGIVSKPKLVGATNSGQRVPEGYSVALAEQGIKDLQAALEKETDDEKKFSMATRLQIMAQTHKAYRFQEYKQRAENEFNVPELERSIAAIHQSELASPHNPRNGMPSQQRYSMMETLGVQRQRAASRISEMLAMDPTINAAEALAKGTILEMEGKLRFAGKKEAVDAKKAQNDAREALISSYDPHFLENVSIMTRGKVVDDLRTIAEGLVDKKIVPSREQLMLAGANDEAIKNFYIGTKDLKEKEMALRLLEEREKKIAGPEQAARNIKLFRTLSEKNLANEGDLSISPDIKRRYKQAQTEVTAQAAASGRSKDEMMAERTVGLKREMLSEVTRNAFYNDVAAWNGLIRSDATAQAIMKQFENGFDTEKFGKYKSLDPKKSPQDTLNVNRFIDLYLNYNDGRSMADKNKALQAIITSSSEALPKSAILPIPTPESIMLETQAMVARAMMNQQRYTTPYNRFGG